ncbi:hypothetical protein [Streptomyces californicus]|uniref:hypothetical protein n=1 Tax=Streptomyces californicus TaxID=67351 RepID=UPI0036A360E5
MSESIANGPFPIPATREDQEAWIEAVLATEGVNLPRGAVENIAPFIVDPDQSLSEPDAHGVRTLKASAVRRIRTDAGDMTIAVVRMHGVGGVLWGHNERISSIWRSVADPTVDQGTERALTSVRPWMSVDDDGRETCFAALESVTTNRQTLIMNAEDTADALKRRDRIRPYDLEEELVLNGQQDPGMYVAQQVRIEENPEKGSDGNHRYPDSYWGWMAVRGNNRTQKRQSIFRLTSSEVLSGVPAEKLEREGEEIFCDPRDWLPEFSAVLNREFAEAGDDELDPTSGSRARRAAAIAVVDAHLVIGTTTPQRLYRIVQMNNRRDHVHPPLEFDALDRSRALGRSVLGMYVAQQVMDEKTAEVLSGLAPIRELPDVPADMTVSELRDLRSMRLLQELFPVDPHKRHLLRRALSENPPSQLKAGEINQRARTWSALTSESYPAPWNPRVGQVFSTRAREGIVLSGRRLPDLLAAADTDDSAFDELVSYRAAHWLAFFCIIEADRGSLDGQEVIGDAGERVRRSRRTVMNCLQALRYEKSRMMAVGVLRSLAAAMDAGDRRPWRVSSSGVEMPGREMTPLWFDSVFPKDTGTRPRKTVASAPALPTTATVPAPLLSPTLPALSPRTPTPSPLASTLAHPPAPALTAAVPAQSKVPATNGPAEKSSSAPSSEEPLTLEALTVQAEEQIRNLHAASVGIGELLGRLAEQSRTDSVDHPISRQRADAAVRLLNQTLSRLRRLPELMEEMTQPF